METERERLCVGHYCIQPCEGQDWVSALATQKALSLPLPGARGLSSHWIFKHEWKSDRESHRKINRWVGDGEGEREREKERGREREREQRERKREMERERGINKGACRTRQGVPFS